MPRVLFNNVVIAESDQTQIVEGNHYFPPNSIKHELFTDSANDTHTTCAWKGRAHYYDITVDGERAADAAWYYPEPKSKAANIKDYVAFYRGKVTIED